MSGTPSNTCIWEETSEELVFKGASDCSKSHFDVIIVGAGYTGLSSALALAEAGKSVVVLETGLPGHGGSGRNGGQVQAGFGTSLSVLLQGASPQAEAFIRALASDCAGELFALVDKHGIKCDPVRGGLLRGIHHPRLLDTMKSRTEADPALRYFDKGKTAEYLGADIYHGAVFDPRSGRINPMAFVRGLARAAEAAGATIITSCAATELEAAVNAFKVRTAKGSFSGDQLVLATNAYADDLLPALKRSIVVVNSFQIATAPFEGGPLLDGAVASDTRRLVFYYRRDKDGRLIVGGRGQPKQTGNFGGYSFLREWLHRSFPQTRAVPITHFWAGRVAITLDHIPHAHEPIPGLHIVTGYNGKGVAMATAMGMRLADRILSGSPEALALPRRALIPVPFWRFRNLGVSAHVMLYRQLDRIGR